MKSGIGGDTIARDTIAAISSGTGGAVAVIRLSGPRAGEAVRALCGRLPEPRRASLTVLRDPGSGDRLDEGLALWFPGPRSATGEDMAELQIHGGRAVTAAVLGALFALPGVRPAEAGEFTRRAFLNGRMDLASAEGLADLIAADTEGQRRLALAHAFGHLGAGVEAWRRQLVQAMALIEAGIDFSDEADVPLETRAMARPLVEGLADALRTALADRRGALLREGAVIALAGLPNAGKSSLMNALAARDVAIVSDEPGTTRDVLEVALDLSGHKVTLLDTAGLREATGKVEAEGIRRARARIGAADLVLWVHDAAAGPVPVEPPLLSDREGDMPGAGDGPVWWVLANKSDLAATSDKTATLDETTGSDLAARSGGGSPGWAAASLAVSATTGEGLADLLAALAAFVAARVEGTEPPMLVRERHRSGAVEALGHVTMALAGWEDLSEELLAEELRLAARALGRITGAIGAEDLLDVVFREFCIGK